MNAVHTNKATADTLLITVARCMRGTSVLLLRVYCKPGPEPDLLRESGFRLWAVDLAMRGPAKAGPYAAALTELQPEPARNLRHDQPDALLPMRLRAYHARRAAS